MIATCLLVTLKIVSGARQSTTRRLTRILVDQLLVRRPTLVLETQTYFCCSAQTPVKHISNHFTMKLPVFLLVSICSGSDPASQSSATTTTTTTSRNLCSLDQFACGDNSCVSLEVISYVPYFYFNINFLILC